MGVSNNLKGLVTALPAPKGIELEFDKTGNVSLLHYHDGELNDGSISNFKVPVYGNVLDKIQTNPIRNTRYLNTLVQPDKKQPVYAVEEFRPVRTFSGADIKCVVHTTDANNQTSPLVIANLQTISYSIHREKYPVRELGKARPVAYTRGTVTIAGTMIFTMIDREALWELMYVNPLDKDWNNSDQMYSNTMPMLNQLPPFDISIVFQNEYGDIANMAIYGVEIVDEGMSMSIDDMITEKTCSYVALEIDILTPYSEGSKYGMFAINGISGRDVGVKDYDLFLDTLKERRHQIFDGDTTAGYNIPYDAALFQSIQGAIPFKPSDIVMYNHYGLDWECRVDSYVKDRMQYLISPTNTHPISTIDASYYVYNSNFISFPIATLENRYKMKISEAVLVSSNKLTKGRTQ